jgi:NADPH-dependent 2,4-dienoyl-CoA reductase/sulfur reductase-like enzyme/rhodanese-related sulfurtransferase
MTDTKKRILIVGGVAGGASCAARARRLCERCEIVIFDRGLYVSFANCGLPYYVGDVIEEEEKLLVANPNLFKDRFNIEVCTETEVLTVDREQQEIEVRDLKTGKNRRERYDALVLSPGARAIRPPIPGADLSGIHVVRTIPDSRKIRKAVEDASKAIVVGGGFIGLEMAENLSRRGISVSLVEMSPQVMPPLDPEMASLVAERLREHGVSLYLGAGVSGFKKEAAGGLAVSTSAGDEIAGDIVILAIGIRPETKLAQDTGLELGERGGIRVDDQMRTNDPRIWAVGDAVEVRDFVMDSWQLIPLAGPANRQGRIAAASIIGQINAESCAAAETMRFRGVQGTAVCGVFGLTIALTGACERTLRHRGVPYEKVYLHPGSHVGYYPGAKPIHMKLLFDPGSGRILGAQAVGEEGTARRIDVIAMAIQMGGTVFDLEEAELCYAPQYGAAKDPVNLAGMVAANHLRGDLPLAKWEELADSQAQILDVRSAAEFQAGHLGAAKNIPLEELRDRLAELSRDREIWLVCGVGQRAYYATRLLLQGGYRVKNLSGGMQTHHGFEAADR